MICSRIRTYHPSTREEQSVPPEVEVPQSQRGRPRGTPNVPQPVPVRQEKVLGICYEDHSTIPPELWNLLVSLLITVFKGLLKIAKKLRVEAPGHEQETLLFVDLPRLFFGIICELATWWWSYDKGYLGAVLRCDRCGCDLKYKGDVEKKMLSLFGIIRPRRAYYVCTNPECTVPSKDGRSSHQYSVCPLDRRLGLDQHRFLPSVQQVVVWLTSLDPYGKCLEFIGKLLQFTICHRSAWLITQQIGDTVQARQQEAIEQAFGDPRTPVFPAAEVPAPAVGVVMVDGTCGRIDHADEPAEEDPAEEDPDAPARTPDFREVKSGLVAHLVPPVPRAAGKTMEQAPPAAEAPGTAPAGDDTKPTEKMKKKKKRSRPKVRPHGEEPTLAHRKLAVHLGQPLRLFQMLLLLIFRLGLDKAQVILVIGDGARWIWRGVQEHLWDLGVKVVEILDYWHAVEHLWEVANAVLGKGTPEAVAWVKDREAELLKGQLTDFFASFQGLLDKAQQMSDKLVAQVEKELNYFRNNESRINYGDYLTKGYLIGSGAMEGTCKHLVKERIDRAGMHWGPSGVMAVLNNRTLIKNGDWDRFWKDEAERRQGTYQLLKVALTS